jgi:hypothetical protein
VHATLPAPNLTRAVFTTHTTFSNSYIDNIDTYIKDSYVST